MQSFGLFKYFLYALMAFNVFCSDTDDLKDLELPDMVHLTTSTFDKLVTQGESVWLVEFVIPDCGPCRTVLPELNKTTRALKGIAKIGIVNVKEEKGLSERFDIERYPTFKIFIAGSVKSYDWRKETKHLADAVLYHITEKVRNELKGPRRDKMTNVIELTDMNFVDKVLRSKESWLVMFYAPWCGHCKNFKPHFHKAATQLEGKINMGALDATVNVNIANKFQITGYPTVKYFPAGDKRSNIEYRGGRMAEQVVEWVNSRITEDRPPPKVTQITEKTVFEEGCVNKILCVILFTPDLLDCNASCRNQHLEMIQELGNEFKHKNWGWLWSEPNVQIDLEKALDIGGFGYPAIVVMNSKKMRYSCFRGSFNKKSIREFLEDISSLKVRNEPLRDEKLPEIADVYAWNGTDVPQIYVEEEGKVQEEEIKDKSYDKEEL